MNAKKIIVMKYVITRNYLNFSFIENKNDKIQIVKNNP